MYILQSESSKMYYVGSTENLSNRLVQHNKGNSRFTKNKGPFKVVYKEDFSTLSEAKKREYYIKSLKSRKAIEKLIKLAPIV